MWQWLRRLFGLASKPDVPTRPKRRTALQRLNNNCAHDVIEYERQLRAAKRRQQGLNHGDDPGIRRKPA
jgi:hypothetical protein